MAYKGDPQTGAMMDLETVRMTLRYMRDDLQGERKFARVADAINAAISEIDAVNRRPLPPVFRRIVGEG